MSRSRDFFDTPPGPAQQSISGFIISPLADTQRIYALPTRAAREAALLELTIDRHNLVSHFLILKFAAEMKHSAQPDVLLAGVPSHLVEDVKRLTRSYSEAARIVAASRS